MGLNPWFAAHLAKLHSPPGLPLLVHASNPEALRVLQAIPGIQFQGQVFDYYKIWAPLSEIEQIGKLPGVTVHYNAPVGVTSAPSRVDPLLGKVGLSSITFPWTPREMPGRLAALSFKSLFSKSIHDPRVIIKTMGDTRKMLNPPADVHVTNTRVGVLDSGFSWPNPAFPPNRGVPHLASTHGPSPVDLMGHGTWCVTALGGWPTWTRFGQHEGVIHLDPGLLHSYKVLGDTGMGSVSDILHGMEKAIQDGCKVLSMSLGGPLQGSVHEDPLCRILEQYKDDVIFVVAAGNSGPDAWTIGSPGASPHAITVGAASPVSGELAYFSSIGPNGDFYRNNQQAWKDDLALYGDRLRKPDIICPGGGPQNDGDQPELILSGMTGWMQPAYTYLPDYFGALRGSSQATPQAAGLIALAYERGLIRTADDVRLRLSRNSQPKNTGSGYGLLTWDMLQTSPRG